MDRLRIQYGEQNKLEPQGKKAKIDQIFNSIDSEFARLAEFDRVFGSLDEELARLMEPADRNTPLQWAKRNSTLVLSAIGTAAGMYIAYKAGQDPKNILLLGSGVGIVTYGVANVLGAVTDVARSVSNRS